MFNIRNKLYEEAYILHDDVDGEWYYYNEHEAFLSRSTLEHIGQIVTESVKVASEMYDAIDVITQGDDCELDVANDFYESLCTLSRRMEEITTWDSLNELADFDPENYINTQLQEEYAMEAYEENLEDYIGKASDNASDIVFDLTSTAHEDIDILLNEIDNDNKQSSGFLQNLQERKTKKINPQIDNT